MITTQEDMRSDAAQSASKLSQSRAGAGCCLASPGSAGVSPSSLVLGRNTHQRRQYPRSPGFTLVELILVMALLVIVISISGPSLANFFRGRTLDSEARRLLSLTHAGQSRAASEGIPMRLWLDMDRHTYGLQQDPSWGQQDPKAIDFALDKDLQVRIVNDNRPRASASRTGLPSTQSNAAQRNLPEIRFLPDGSIDDGSPRALRMSDRSGTTLWLAQATNRLSYEIRQTYE